MSRGLLCTILGLALATASLAEGEAFRRSSVTLTWGSAATVDVDEDEDEYSDPVLIPGSVFNAASVSLSFSDSPNVVPMVQVLSPIDGETWTELFADPVLTADDAAVTSEGHYIYVLSIPLVSQIRIRLDGVAGGETTVSGVVMFQ